MALATAHVLLASERGDVGAPPFCHVGTIFVLLLLEFTLFALCFRPGTKESVHGFFAEEVYAKKKIP